MRFGSVTLTTCLRNTIYPKQRFSLKYIELANLFAELMIEVLEETGDWADDPEKWVESVGAAFEKLEIANAKFEMESDIVVDFIGSIDFDSDFKDGSKDYARVDRAKMDALLELLVSVGQVKH